MTTTISKKTTVTITLDKTEMDAIRVVTDFFTHLSDVISDNFNDENCDFMDLDNDMSINVPSDEIGTIAMHLEEFTATKLIKLSPAD